MMPPTTGHTWRHGNKMMCEDVILDLLLDYLDQTLGSDLAQQLEAHLKICPPCLAYLETYTKTRDLAATAAALPAMPDEMKTRLREFLVEKLAREKP